MFFGGRLTVNQMLAPACSRSSAAILRSGLGEVHALLQQPEVRADALIPGDELTVEDQPRLQRERSDLGIGNGSMSRSLRLYNTSPSGPI